MDKPFQYKIASMQRTRTLTDGTKLTSKRYLVRYTDKYGVWHQAPHIFGDKALAKSFIKAWMGGQDHGQQ